MPTKRSGSPSLSMSAHANAVDLLNRRYLTISTSLCDVTESGCEGDRQNRLPTDERRTSAKHFLRTVAYFPASLLSLVANVSILVCLSFSI